jgi:photosystem II stability/assembly factor-like uncharacterized protein
MVSLNQVAGSVMLACMALPGVVQAAFQDPLDFPAVKVSRVEARPTHAVAKAGSKLVAVGPRGLIAISSDQGQSWSQVPSPVQSDLVAVHFPTAANGWAVGHDGVVLHSADGGASWVKQLDGRAAKAIFTRHYAALGDSEAPAVAAARKAIEQNYKAGASLPWLGVWFDDELHGFAVGAFGLLVATSDGGKTWTPWLERIDNPELLSLNAVSGGDGGVYIVAERGGIFRLDRAKGRFVHTATGYAGSFFGVAVSKKVALAYGLRGAIYRSADGGEHWSAVAAPSAATISAGAAMAESGDFVLANQAGELLLGDPTGTHFFARKASQPWRYTGTVQAYNGKLLFSSLEGIQIERVK